MSYYNAQPYYPTYPQNTFQPMQIQQSQQQMMTPPTIRAEIIQYGDEIEVDRFPMNAGASQMFISKDENTFIVKTMYANGQYNKDYYDKRPPAPPKPELDPSQFVTRDEIDGLIEAAVAARIHQDKGVA